VTAPLADQLPDYLTFGRNADRQQRLLSELPLLEINAIRRAIELEPIKSRYTGPVRKKAPRVRAEPIKRTDTSFVGEHKRPKSLRHRCVDIAPRLRGDAQPASWFAITLNEPTANVGAALSDLFGRGAIQRRPAAKCDLDTAARNGRTRQWIYWSR
jgi:hypothetical protein